MADELTNFRVVLQRQNRDAHSAIQDLLSEREQFRQEMVSTHKYGPCSRSELSCPLPQVSLSSKVPLDCLFQCGPIL